MKPSAPPAVRTLLLLHHSQLGAAAGNGPPPGMAGTDAGQFAGAEHGVLRRRGRNFGRGRARRSSTKI